MELLHLSSSSLSFPFGISCFRLKRCRFPFSPTPPFCCHPFCLKPFQSYLKSLLRNPLENILETFPAHHRKHRCQIAGCQACGCQHLLFPPGCHQELCDRELFLSSPCIALVPLQYICLECIFTTLWITESYVGWGEQSS